MPTPVPASLGLHQLPVQRVQPAYEQVAEQLRQLILRGDIAPGERLPVEGVMCEMFGVSRSTVREALRALAARDLVRTTRGTTGGTFVARIEASKVSDYLETSLGMLSAGRAVSMAEILETRALIEVPAAGLAAERRTEEQAQLLHDLVAADDATPPAQRAGSQGFANRRSFHGAVVDASGNLLLRVVSDPVFRVLQSKFLRPGVPDSFWAEVDDEHREVADRVAARDRQGAEEAMRAHLLRLRHLYTDE